MTVILPEIISEALHTYGLFDEAVTSMVLQLVRPGDVVLDIGAHFGYFSLLFAHLTGPSGRVLSFEPTPSTFNILAANVSTNPVIEALNLAAGDIPGSVEITDFGIKHSAWNTLATESRLNSPGFLPQARKVPVKLERPDEICKQRNLIPNFIKIDAENFEDHVVMGLSGLLGSSRPIVLMESGSQQSLLAAELLVNLGYRLRVSDGPGVLYDWNGTVDQANARFKDIVFSPSDSAQD